MPGLVSPSPSALERLAYGEPDLRIVVKELAPLRPNLAIALLLVLATLVATGCGSDANGGESGGHPDYERALAGAPAPLAGLYAQANELLPGGIEAYEKRLAALHGYPAVVNVWASWCGPCRFEFPHFQQAAARYGKRVAFLGIDSQDSADFARDFLEEEPVPYPSYEDPDEEIADSTDAFSLPATAFYDREGELVFTRQGNYEDVAELRADIERYALGEGAQGG
jgi:cytochrome c biogenesis protein CcmG, thiol:disulfide interchange protein DsbE